MLSHHELNHSLNQLKQIFDTIEPYSPKQNVGYRSLKNIGLWLIIYAFLDEASQMEVIKELGKASDKMDDISHVKNIVQELIRSENLANILKNYQEAEGTFHFTVRNQATLEALQAKAKALNILDIIEPHLKIDESMNSDFHVSMQNEILYRWMSSNNNSTELKKGNQFVFTGLGKIPYLSANNEDHSVSYDLVCWQNNLYHVSRFDVGSPNKTSSLFEEYLNEEKGNDSAVYLIEPADHKSSFNLQKDYWNIVNLFKKDGDYQEKYFAMKLLAKSPQQDQLKISGQCADKDFFSAIKEFRVIVNFPEIAEMLTTTEMRLGIYSYFLNKSMGGVNILTLDYSGQRGLEYDEKGGRIFNLEDLNQTIGMRSYENKVTIEYTTKGPYLMVYEANQGSDYYPFYIANPRKNLKNNFLASDTYPICQTKPNISQLFKAQSQNDLQQTTQTELEKTIAFITKARLTGQEIYEELREQENRLQQMLEDDEPHINHQRPGKCVIL
jgi:hypothetical protein